jgi:hypothetical protein
MACLAFYVQNFNKDIPTVIFKNSRRIEAFEGEGQEIIRKIDDLALHGSELVNESNVRIIHKKNAEFYVELITEQLDASGRPAKIGIYGRKPSLSWEYSFEDWVFDIFDRVKEFSIEVDRSVKQEQLRIIRSGLKSIYYQHKIKAQVMLIVKLALGSFIPILVGLLLGISPFIDVKSSLFLSGIIGINNIFLILLIQDKV